MAWNGVKKDWSNSDIVSSDDLNRINANIRYLYPLANLKVNYTKNDFLTLQEWNAMLAALSSLKAAERITTPLPANSMVPATFNSLESLVEELYERQILLTKQHKADVYPQDLLYAGENYVRGL